MLPLLQEVSGINATLALVLNALILIACLSYFRRGPHALCPESPA